jgi:copper chaperone CopZ
MKEILLKVPNISCDHCVRTIEMELGDISGVVNVKANSDSKSVVVEFGDPAHEEDLLNLLEEINYPASR